MIVYWSEQALNDSQQIWEYLAEKNPDAAVKMDELFEASAERLADFPYMGHEGEIAGTREIFPHENYRLIYEIRSDDVWVLALVHTSQLWPRMKGG
ncbi:type II toxin-antitoxin system RelE/ParE family toxin [Brenneria tiliae]|uniref:Type II toxin-antitoxin system RelE/ParE family toxin n=1 Tax=Brenneria tiliae TaxID=2914984 RepID=A0ABT0N2K6_9GAMM|nr:type II toxin-antitoxin system RelE/ParE family toxin [Brenneria tiliae]MCL2895798.1 type II toxin-antitoxin system RelE/ParE family toxin [Brenneria tiliae]MCL2900295.1 type II toxin-antitoxin system RelE/ParE family toxin [Brenneria tiliae]MCL2904218.1 type II toxin-antitoxin system RelE/ParE family toxin [Brenneria tiliae]